MFTPFAVPCNIDFEAIAENEYPGYHYELLPATFEKLSSRDPKAYEKPWGTWLAGSTRVCWLLSSMAENT